MRVYLFALGMIALIPLSVGQSADLIDRIVAKVDDAIITKSDIDEATAMAIREIQAKYPEDQWDEKTKTFRNQVLMQMIDEYVCQRAAKELEITVADEEIQTHIQSLWKKSGIPSEDAFLDELRKEGLTMDELKAIIRRQVLTRKVLQKEVYANFQVNEADIQQYYNENKKLYYQPARDRIALLFLEVNSDLAEEWERVHRQIEEIHEQLKNGAEFETLVKKHSQGPSPDAGGDIGFIEKGKALPEIEAAVADMQEGQISGPFRTEHGWNIVKLMVRQGDSFKPLSEVRADIETLLQRTKASDLERNWIEKQRSKTYIEVISE